MRSIKSRQLIEAQPSLPALPHHLTCLPQHSPCVHSCRAATELRDARCWPEESTCCYLSTNAPQHWRNYSLVVRDPAPHPPLCYNARLFCSCNVQSRLRFRKESIIRFILRTAVRISRFFPETLWPSAPIHHPLAPTRALGQQDLDRIRAAPRFSSRRTCHRLELRTVSFLLEEFDDQHRRNNKSLQDGKAPQAVRKSAEGHIPQPFQRALTVVTGFHA